MENQPDSSATGVGFVAARSPVVARIYTTSELRCARALAAARRRQALRRFYAEYRRLTGRRLADARAASLHRRQAEDLLRIAVARGAGEA